MFISDLLQFYWNGLRMTLNVHEGTKIQPSTHFSSNVSAMQKANQPQTNTYFRSTSGSLSFWCSFSVVWFCQWAERPVFASLSGQTAPFSYPPATTITHKYLSLIFISAFQVTPVQLGTHRGSFFCFLCFGCCLCTVISKAQCRDTSAAGLSLHAAVLARDSLLSKNSVDIITRKSE